MKKILILECILLLMVLHYSKAQTTAFVNNEIFQVKGVADFFRVVSCTITNFLQKVIGEDTVKKCADTTMVYLHANGHIKRIVKGLTDAII